MYDEDYMVVEVWNEQVGAWETLDEFTSIDEAKNFIAEAQKENQENYGRQFNYSVLQVKREVIKGV
jgi:chlorite dismutase